MDEQTAAIGRPGHGEIGTGAGAVRRIVGLHQGRLAAGHGQHIHAIKGKGDALAAGRKVQEMQTPPARGGIQIGPGEEDAHIFALGPGHVQGVGADKGQGPGDGRDIEIGNDCVRGGDLRQADAIRFQTLDLSSLIEDVKRRRQQGRRCGGRQDRRLSRRDRRFSGRDRRVAGAGQRRGGDRGGGGGGRGRQHASGQEEQQQAQRGQTRQGKEMGDHGKTPPESRDAGVKIDAGHGMRAPVFSQPWL